jgi:hypothetical protein
MDFGKNDDLEQVLNISKIIPKQQFIRTEYVIRNKYKNEASEKVLKRLLRYFKHEILSLNDFSQLNTLNRQIFIKKPDVCRNPKTIKKIYIMDEQIKTEEEFQKQKENLHPS